MLTLAEPGSTAEGGRQGKVFGLYIYLVYLEVRVGEHVGRRVEVLEFLEGRHDLVPDDAAALVHQLDRGAQTVVRNTVTHLRANR